MTDNDAVRRETVVLNGFEGTLTSPSSRAEAAPAVVFLHPFGAWDRTGLLTDEVTANGTVRLFDDLAAACAARGAIAFGYDSRFVTESLNDGAGSARLTFTGMVEDAVAAVKWLSAHEEVDPARVSLLGISMGTEVALAAAEELDAPHQLILVAPVAENYAVRRRWMNLQRHQEWLVSAGYIDADGNVDLSAAARDTSGRSGWWDDFDLDDRLGSRVPAERLWAHLTAAYDEATHRALHQGDESGPASFWQDWSAQPHAYQRAARVPGPLSLHVGDDDWTTPPRQAWLVHHAATAHGVASSLRGYPGLGHLMSRPHADGTRTYGPFAPEVVEALVRDVTGIA
ncbi:alpha/beta hydrolase fold domain-containing protein [Streptomyces sp. NPDC003077]|uniref:alpha/beta hydrolase family protein n=1 Tax=Streptomyces sp. NPDC003077 TaxID=3154443 RepID=UPI0033A7F951